jgi:hypothetical protein
MLGVGRSSLRRRSDRFESLVLRWGLVLMVATLILAPTIGVDTYQREMKQVATQTATRHQVFAVVLENTGNQPPSSAEPSGIAPPPVRVRGSWKAPDGSTHTAPMEVENGTLAGARVPIWVTWTGQQVPAPETPAGAAIGAVLASAGIIAFAFALFVAIYWLIRWPLDRLRSASWDRDWQRVSSHWSDGPRRIPPGDELST